MQCGGLIDGGDAHQTPDIKAAIFAAEFQKLTKIFGGDADLLVFCARIDLNQAGDISPLFLHFRRQSVREFFAVQRFDHIKKGHSLLYLVGLEGADQMKLQIRVKGFYFPPMGDGFLYAVFAEETVAGVQRLADFFGRLRFADGDEVDVVTDAAPFAGSFFDIVSDCFEIFADGHRAR